MATWEQKKLIFDKLAYYPTAVQEPIHKNESRIRLVAGGERSGKSFSSAAEYLSRFWESPLVWLVAADYSRTKAEYDYICEGFEKLHVNYQASRHVDPGEITIEGGFRIVTKSAQDYRKLAMEAPDGIIGCEASQLDYETFLRLRGRIAEKRGWLLLSGTFESSVGWYVEAYNRGQAPNEEDLVSFSLPTWSNLAIFPLGKEDPEIKALEAASSKEWFMERFGGLPSPPKGVVFNEFRNHIHTGIGGEYEFDPAGLVYLWVDPGFQHAYAVEVAQKHGEDIYIIDEIYERNLVTSDIIKIAKQRPWWNRVIGGAIDIAGRQHQAMPAPIEVWLQEGGIPLRSQRIRIQDGIERMKSCLNVNPLTNKPMLHINAKCKGLISELGGCPSPLTGQTAIYKWRQDSQGALIGDTPDDKNNDAAKATIYGLVDLIGYTPVLRKQKIKFF